METLIMMILMTLFYGALIWIGVKAIKYFIRYGVDYYIEKKNENKGRE